MGRRVIVGTGLALISVPMTKAATQEDLEKRIGEVGYCMPIGGRRAGRMV